MDTSKSVVFPNEMLDEMEIEDTFFPTNSNEVGIAILSHLQDSAHIMRIYQLFLNSETSSFEPIQELASFSFATREHFDDFLKMLPNLTGLEMLMLLNPITTDENVN
ncbi:hypothetical protein KQY62_002967 [Listeria monocytogenes]|uniref:hypothetical protein n=1 Tax=Listeria monocytogenes TaxID=1639 RepID=UPI000FBDAF13|nr:hypothetical protein [Listeria monocytogenes]EAC4040237.1 hypothetical protein [Listeria monocytogenes]EAD4645561.1 hypothetical protein [Listeria monocytogenes]EAF3291284.1 hypothetical protein [Listeria monocytogenes]EAG7889014.1 hypothetical protein [Listeria monocytogenes]ECZ8741662.1 hypothetical protein [Listeria monocytogenes]